MPALKSDSLGAEMAWCVIGDSCSRSTAEIRIESGFVPDRPEEFTGIHNRSCNLHRCRPVLQAEQRRMFSPHHHGTGRIDRDDPGAFFNKRQEDLHVRTRLPAKRFQVAAFPSGHPAALEASDATYVDAVSLQHFNCIAPNLGFIVLHVAGLKEDDFATCVRLDLSCAHRPLLECRTGKIGQQFISMDTEYFFQKDSMEPYAIRNVRNAEAGARKRACAIGIAHNAVAQTEPLALRPLSEETLHQPRKIQFEFVPITLGIRTLNLAQLALETGIHYCHSLAGSDLTHIPVMVVINGRKETRKTVAIFETEPATVTDLKRSLDLFVQGRRVPIFPFLRIVGKPVSRPIRDVLVVLHAKEAATKRHKGT